jgi:hypothetical protein
MARPLPEALDALEWGRYNLTICPTIISTCWSRRNSPAHVAAAGRFMKIADLEKPVGDPLTALKHLQRGIYDSFEYESGVTEVIRPSRWRCGGAASARTSPIS